MPDVEEMKDTLNLLGKSAENLRGVADSYSDLVKRQRRVVELSVDLVIWVAQNAILDNDQRAHVAAALVEIRKAGSDI